METSSAHSFGYIGKWLFIIILGAFVGALIRSRRGETKGAIDILVLTIIGGFTGYIAFLAGAVYIADEQWLGVFAGCMAALGQQALELILGFFETKLKNALEEPKQ